MTYESCTTGAQKDGETVVKIFGSQDHIVEIAEELSWLGAVCRIPQHGKLILSDTVLEWRSGNEFDLSLLELQTPGNKEVSCWYPLFESGIIADAYPISPGKVRWV